MVFSSSLPDDLFDDFADVFTQHYFGDISDAQLDGFLRADGTSGLGNDIRFDAAGKLIEIDGVIVETASYSQTGTTATIVQAGDQDIAVGDVLNLIFNVGSANEVRQELAVASVISGTSFTVTRPSSETVSAEVVSFYKEDVPKTATYTQSGNTITITHSGAETLTVGDTIDLNISSGSATTENVVVTSVISATEFKVESSTSVSTSGNATFTKQNREAILRGEVDGISTTTDSILSSKQSNDIIDVLSEGEITGFKSAVEANLTQGTNKYDIASLKDVFLNGTQVLKKSADINNLTEGDFNFIREDISFESRFGTSNQTALKTINEIESETGVGVEVTKASPVSRSISSQIDKLRITIAFPTLQKFNTETGETNGTQVNLSIKITENNGTEHRVIKGTKGAVIGKTNTQYFRDYIITGLSNLNYPITATVTRVTNDSTDTNLQNKFSWSSFTEITAEQRAYPNIAHVGLRFNAESFRSIPTRTYRIRGIKVKIPHNATVRSDGSLSFSGSFNGTLKTDKEYTNDPAWVLYDVLTNTRYGASIPETSIDKFAFYSASEYNSTQIDDGSGTGTTEARFSCNVNINNQKDAFELIQDICSVMRVQAFYEAGSISISQDRPSSSVYTFNNSNVLEGGFSYSNQSQKAKYTRINVGFFDMTTQAIDYETVDDTTAQSRYGIKTQTIKAFGTTSRGQASRMAKWLLFNQNNSSEIVNFSITAEAGVLVRPNQVISIADEVKQGVRRGGRIKTGISTTQIQVDDTASTDLVTSNSAKLSVILSDGTLETRDISAISSATVTVSSAFSSVPQANSVWVIENTTLEPTTWRVVNVQEQENLTFSITAASHNSGKYAFVEDGTALPTKRFSLIIQKLPAPQNLTATESIVVINNKAVARLSISYAAVKGAIGYYLQYKFENGNFINQQVKGTDFDIDNINSGRFVIRVSSINTINKLSERANEITFNAIGKTALPDDVQNVQIEPLSDQFVRLRFDKSTSVDVVHGGNVVIRSSNLTTGATFTNAVDVVPELSGNISESIVPNIVNGTYLLAFKDDGGRLSANPASIKNINTKPDVFPKLTILEDREDLDNPPFQGVRDDCFFSDEVNGLVLGSTVLLDDISDFDAIADFDFIGDVDFLTGGQYFFKSTLDLGGKQPLRLRRHFVTQGFYPNDLFDTRTANVDTWTDFDGATAFNVNATLSVATTDSDPDLSVSATYTINDGSGGAGTTITITKSSHGYSVGSLVTLDFTSGTGVDGDYLIASVPNANTFILNSATSLNTSGNCTYSAEFEPYQKFVNGTYIGRGFKFKCDLLSTDPAQSIEIDQLGYFAELDSRTETSLGNAAASSGGFIASGVATKSVVFTDSFFTGQSGTSVAANSVLPSIGITIENAQSGDFFTLSNITGSGFDIDIKNGSSHVNRNFKYAATGFGRGS